MSERNDNYIFKFTVCVMNLLFVIQIRAGSGSVLSEHFLKSIRSFWNSPHKIDMCDENNYLIDGILSVTDIKSNNQKYYEKKNNVSIFLFHQLKVKSGVVVKYKTSPQP